MKRLLRRLAYNYAEGGLTLLVRKGITHVWSQTEWRIYVHRVSAESVDNDDGRSLPATITWRQLDSDELVRAGYFKALSFPKDIARRFAMGNACHGFYLEGRLATIGWSSDGYLELDRGLMFSCPSEAGLFDFLTLPEFRSRGIYTYALRQLLTKLHDQGIAVVYIAVDPGNSASIHGIERAGFRQLLLIKRRRRFGIVTNTFVPLHSRL
jgi:GNAT superfamily N-acetyltransferase